MRNLNEETKAALEGIKREQISKNRASADDIADLCQQAEYLALEAAEKFNGDLSSEAFLKYAERYITGGLTMFILNQGDVNIPAATRYEFNRILEIRDKLKSEGKKGTVSETAAAAGVTSRAVLSALRAEILMGPAERMDAKLNEKDGSESKQEFYEITSLPIATPIEDFEDQEVQNGVNETVKNAVESLPRVERDIIYRLMHGMTLADTAKALNLPLYFVRNTKNSALRRLRLNEDLEKAAKTLSLVA